MEHKKNGKKITFVCNHLYGGGAERVLVSLANYYYIEGFEVSIIAFDASKRYPIQEGIRVVQLPIIDDNINKIWRMILEAKNIRQALVEEKSDVIVAFEYYVNMCTVIAHRGMKSKLIISERNDPASFGAEFPKGLLRNFLYLFCDSLVCQTPDAKNYFPPKVRNHTVVIPNPIKQDLPSPWKGERNNVIVNFCRLDQQKNLPLLIETFKKFHEKNSSYTLEIYGDGDEKSNLINIINSLDLGESVSINPAVSDVHNRVLKSAMFVSTSNFEGLSNSMLEAMAIGLPTICTDCPCGGARMMIKNGVNGMLVPVGNCEELLNAMEKIANDKNFACLISNNALQIRKELDIEKIATKWKELF